MRRDTEMAYSVPEARSDRETIIASSTGLQNQSLLLRDQICQHKIGFLELSSPLNLAE